jgi:hypothetical protein
MRKTLWAWAVMAGLWAAGCSSEDTAPPDRSTNNNAATNNAANNAANNSTLNNADNNPNNSAVNNSAVNNSAVNNNTPDNNLNNSGNNLNNSGNNPDNNVEEPDAQEDAPEDMGGEEDAGDMGVEPDVPDMGGDPGGTCDPFGQDCPTREDGRAQQCIPVEGVPTCGPSAATPKAVGEACTQSLDCAPGATCVNWSDGRGQLCTQMCARGSVGMCDEGTSCSAWIQSNPAIGLCVELRATCDIYAQDCEEGQGCTLGRDPDTNDPIFVCETAGTQAPGDECSNGAGRCAAGSICIRESEARSVCRAVCQGDEGCGEGLTCSGRSTTWGVTFCR